MDILLFISGGEIVFILFAVLLIFGAKRIPEIAKGMGKGVKEFRKATDDIKKEFKKENSDMADGLSNLRKTANDIKRNIEKNTDINLKG